MVHLLSKNQEMRHSLVRISKSESSYIFIAHFGGRGEGGQGKKPHVSVVIEITLWHYFCPVSSTANIFVLMNFIDFYVSTS